MRNILLTIVGVFALIGTFTGCDRIPKVVTPEKGVAQETMDTVKIGFLASGSRVTYPNGAKIAVAEINATGGLLGVPVELVTEVGIPTPEAAVEVAARMILDDGVIALVGPNRSAHAIPIGALATEHSLPMITTTATNPTLTDASDFVFMAAFTDAYQGAVMAKFARTELGLTSVALLTQSGEIYSEGISEFFVTNFTAAGGTIAAREYYEIVDTDFTEQLTRIAAAAPDALFIAGWVHQIGPITQQARAFPLLNAAGEPIRLLGTDTWDNPILLDNADAEIEGSFFSGHFSAGTNKPTGKAFVEAYQTEYGALPLGGHAVSYDATKVMLTAIERAGSLDGEAIRAQIAATENYIGATDIASYDENRHPIKSAAIFTITNGEKQFYKQIDP
ncbi:MAG: ABC transporter substrate-binding protein [Candidatus Poribacteria bacterium]|nr:ABC transporter substrate-binding protein [Candidatus Poribacteria bacterium]